MMWLTFSDWRRLLSSLNTELYQQPVMAIMLDNYIECFFFPANGKMKTIEDVINEKRTEKETKKSSGIHSG